jgi:SAM-dependent methyltransferase
VNDWKAGGHELAAWFATPPGRYLLEWEQDQFDRAVADRFGYHALQLGLPELDTLRHNRMPHRWLALPEAAEACEAAGPASVIAVAPPRGIALVTHAAALPFPEASLDLVVLPHTLEFSADPHAVLREVERVLVPEGRVVISGLHPYSLWGLRQWRARWASRLGCQGEIAQPFLPESGDFIAPWRVRDWLQLLSFQTEDQAQGCWRPAVRTERWLQRWSWLDRWGRRGWPLPGAVYFLVAVKRVRGMHLLGPAWKPRRASLKAVAVAQRHPLSKNR